MRISPAPQHRTSTLNDSNGALSRLRQTQRQVANAEQQIATGLAVQRPSDAAPETGALLHLEQRLAERAQNERNATLAVGTLETAFGALSDTQDLLDEAVAIASSQIGIGSDTQTRAAQAEVVQAQIDAVLAAANTQYNGVSVFGGTGSAARGGQIFETGPDGGIRFTGEATHLQTLTRPGLADEVGSHGVEGFGALSSRVVGRDLGVQTLPGTRLTDLLGAAGTPPQTRFQPGTADLAFDQRRPTQAVVDLTLNGQRFSVDLADTDTLQDVADRFNLLIAAENPGAGSVVVGAAGLELNAAAGNTLGIADPVGGTLARALGVDNLQAASGTAVGGDVNPRLTPLTRLADLATPIDLASGLVLSQGGTTVTLDVSAAETVQDLQNLVRGLDLGLRLEADAGGGLSLRSEVAGVTLTVGENGGSTASDLGLRTFDRDTPLTAFRNGRGVSTTAGEDDFRIRLHDGTEFGVDISDAADVAGVIEAVDAATVAAGLAPGALEVGLAPVGNGLVFTDNTAGSSDFVLFRTHQSQALAHLGLPVETNAGPGDTIAGADTAGVRVENLFTHLMDLRDALRSDDTDGITLAGGNLQADVQRNIGAQGTVGTRSQRLGQALDHARDRALAEQEMLSQIRDADLTEVISRYQQLQLQLQASLQVTSQNLQQTLLDYLR